jgi:tetratricopeptide (TPR) repeat protein
LKIAFKPKRQEATATMVVVGEEFQQKPKRHKTAGKEDWSPGLVDAVLLERVIKEESGAVAELVVHSLLLCAFLWALCGNREHAEHVVQVLETTGCGTRNPATRCCVALLRSVLLQQAPECGGVDWDWSSGASDDNGAVLFLTAQLLLKNNQFEKSKALFEKCTKFPAFHSKALNMLGFIFGKMDQPWLALKKFTEAASLDFSNLAALRNCCFMYQLLQNDSVEANMLECMLKARMQLEQGAAAASSDTGDEQAVAAIFAVAPGSGKLLAAGTPALAYDAPPLDTVSLGLRLAQVYSVQRQFAKAVSCYQYLLGKLWDDKGRASPRLDHHDLVLVFRRYCFVLLQSREFHEAIAVSDQLLKKDPTDAAAMSYKAEALLLTDRPQQALAVLDSLTAMLEAADKAQLEAAEKRAAFTAFVVGPRTVTRQPANQKLFDTDARKTLRIRAMNHKAAALTCLKRFSEARELLLQLAKSHVSEPRVAFNCVLLMMRCGETREAAKVWLQFRALPLDQPVSFYDQQLARNAAASAPSAVEASLAKLTASHPVVDSQLKLMDKVALSLWRKEIAEKWMHERI